MYIRFILASTLAVTLAAGEADPSPAAGGRVLVARANSAFKDALVTALADGLTAAGYAPQVVPLADLVAADPAPYHAIVVITMAEEWKKTRTVVRFLAGKDAAVKAKLIVFTTARKTTWKPKLQGIDGITGASKKSTIAAQVQVIVAKVGAR